MNHCHPIVDTRLTVPLVYFWAGGGPARTVQYLNVKGQGQIYGRPLRRTGLRKSAFWAGLLFPLFSRQRLDFCFYHTWELTWRANGKEKLSFQIYRVLGADIYLGVFFHSALSFFLFPSSEVRASKITQFSKPLTVPEYSPLGFKFSLHSCTQDLFISPSYILNI